MTWHESNDTAVIVMLTQLADGMRERCHMYYPAEEGSDTMTVQLTNEVGETTQCTLKLVETTYDQASKSTVRKILMDAGEKQKVVWHILFLSWPDYGAPEGDDRTALLQLIKLSQAKNPAMNHPRIIHCSAGVGRSGTFIALEHLLGELEIGALDDPEYPGDPVFETVSSLREQRMTMVQSDTQYQFLYDILREQYRKRQLAKTHTTKRHAEDEGPATEMLPASGGEPSPKVIRLSKHIKAVFLRDGSRSRKAGATELSSPSESEAQAD
jgi:protein-tyrosine phosphatase